MIREPQWKRQGFKSSSDYFNYLSKKKGFESYADERRSRVLQQGFKSLGDYQEHLARKKGFKSHKEYQENLVQRKGFESLGDYQKELNVGLDNPNIACKTLEKIIKKHPDLIETVFEKDAPEISDIKKKINMKCKSRLLSELLD